MKSQKTLARDAECRMPCEANVVLFDPVSSLSLLPCYRKERSATHLGAGRSILFARQRAQAQFLQTSPSPRQHHVDGLREVSGGGAVLEALRLRHSLNATPRLRPLERRHDPRGLLWVLFGSSACPVCSLSATSSLFSTGNRDERWTVYVYALVRIGPRSRRGCNKRASVSDAFAVLPGG